MTREAVIVAGSRTAVGKSKRGTTRNWRSDDMAALVIEDLLSKAEGLDPADIDDVDALLFAWHPGTMAGPAIVDLLFGVESPSGRLPATFPVMSGQAPVYYNHKNTGRPASPESFTHMDDIPVRHPQSSWGFASFHLDAGYEPLYEFGYGLSYTEFTYSDIRISPAEPGIGEEITYRMVDPQAGLQPPEFIERYRFLKGGAGFFVGGLAIFRLGFFFLALGI